MGIIDWLTLACAVLAGSLMIYFGLLLPSRRWGVLILFILFFGMTMEYGRTAMSLAFGMTAWGYGTLPSYVTRIVVVVALLLVSWISVWKKVGKAPVP